MRDSGAVTYQVAVQRWHDFYVVAGTSAATLVGLLFVGLSLHLRVVVSHHEVRSLARVTLTNFVLILLVSLFMIIREQAAAASVQLVFSGVVSMAIITPSLVAAARSGTRTLRRLQVMARIGLSALGYAGVVAAGALLARKSFDGALNWLLAVMVVLLVVSLRNSWDLLVTVGDAARSEH